MYRAIHNPAAQSVDLRCTISEAPPGGALVCCRLCNLKVFTHFIPLEMPLYKIALTQQT